MQTFLIWPGAHPRLMMTGTLMREMVGFFFRLIDLVDRSVIYATTSIGNSTRRFRN